MKIKRFIGTAVLALVTLAAAIVLGILHAIPDD